MDIDQPASFAHGPEAKAINGKVPTPPLADHHPLDRRPTPKLEPSEMPREERVDRMATSRVGTPSARPRSERDVDDAAGQASSSQRSRRPSPMDPQNYASLDRPLNVTDALTYLDAVKSQFQDQPDVYNHFLDIMKEFKNEQIDTPGVIKRVSYLFNGHPALIQGFNTFLPVGYRIECSTDPYDAGFITVTTPSGSTVQATTSNGGGQTLSWSTGPPPPPRHNIEVDHPPPPASPDPRTFAVDGQAIEPAVQYVQKIKQRCDPDTYRQFLDILSRYHHASDTIDEEEVSNQIATLFANAPDLREDFSVFMPGKGDSHARDREKNRRKLDVVASSMSAAASLPQKRKRKLAEKEREREKEPTPAKAAPPAKKPKHASAQDLTPISYHPKHAATAPPSPRRPTHHALPPPPPRMPPANDETQFFDRVKRALDNREIYNEFLKLVNLFAQDYIDTARLVKESRHFLGETELYKQFREILGWDEKKEKEHYLAEQQSLSSWTKPAIKGLPQRPGRIDLSEKYGSYRRVPASEANVPCSGRDEMCRSVLNDEWVSHPTWTSEDWGFTSGRKNIYEEALHRTEEERHEYDFHIEAIVRTIAMLEPINNKIAQMNPEDRGNFKLKANLGGSWKAIHQRVIKKIYGREAGLEVIQAMQDVPASAIPVVLGRLKLKEEEWKRGQRAWNKMWREVDARNYAKSLDHQAITWKLADKKALTAKALVHQIETAREEQMAKRAALVDPLFARTRVRYQLEFAMEDAAVLQDAVKLVFSFLDRTQGQLNVTERRRIESFLRTYIPLFFALNPVEFNSAFVVHDLVESDAASDVDVASVHGADDSEGLGGSSRAGGKGRNGRSAHHHTLLSASGGGDLRKKLLKAEQAKSTSRKTRAQDAAASPAASRFASPVVVDEEREAAAAAARVETLPYGPGRRSSRVANVFFTNTTFYAMMRLLEVLYSRLHLFKGIAAKLAQTPTSSERDSPPGPSTSTAPKVNGNGAVNHYEMLLGRIEALFTNEIEQNVFEDQTRAIFGTKDSYKIFTVDKVIGAVIKQVQAVIADPKSQELLEFLKRERSLASPTTQDRINHRRQAEKVLGPDENVFRIDWLSESKLMTIQLIGKDDSSWDDSEVLTNRWQSYIDAYVSGETTEGVPQARVKRPYLRRNLPAAVRETQPDVSSQDGLEIKVCLRTYRLFYVPRTEDFMWRYRYKEEMEKNSKQLALRNGLRRKWLAAESAAKMVMES
ncbi:histone deacetylase complex, SIN3 component [Pholiota molesta]|nr:histone deacetylase complex, SIN3 component [Pholiota molesta]